MKTLLKAVFTLVLLALVFRAVDPARLAQAFLNLRPGYVALAVGALLVSTAIASWRWHLIMRSLDFRASEGFHFRSYFKGAFFNQALPGSIGGDAVRVLDVAALGYRKRDAFVGIFIDRIVGLSGLLVLNLTANNLTHGLLPGWLFRLVNLICLSGLAGVLLLMFLHRSERLGRIKLLLPFTTLSRRFRQVYHSWQASLGQLALSVVIHLFPILALFFLARATGLDIKLGVFMVVAPPVFLLTLLPVSLAGWGVREGAMVGLFVLIGEPREAILTLSLLYGLAQIVASLPGLYFLWRSKHPKRRPLSPNPSPPGGGEHTRG